MELDLFLQEKSFKKHAKNINSIREDFINMGCEKYLWRNFREEMSDMKNTEKIISSFLYTTPKIVKKFIKQFSNIDLQLQIPFIYPEKSCKNYFIINNLVHYAVSESIIENLITDDETKNHLAIFNINDVFKIALMHKLVYSACFSNNFGGYKIYNEDLLYYTEFAEYNKIVLSYPRPNKFTPYQGCTFRGDTDPYKILAARNNITHIIDNKFFNSELELFLSIYNDIYPIFQSWWNASYNILFSFPNIQLREEIDRIYSELVANNVINSKWLNEKSLFQLVKKKYKKALFQYSPEWLFPQSFDIFIPELNIAIEYQGIQHYKPIDHFGGDEGFKHRQELDTRKKQLTADNNIKLIEWHYSESIDLETLNQKLSL